MIGLYLEEVAAGLVIELGQHHFTRDEIVGFARKYDPQPFHLDEEAARKGPLGSLSASGWHTAAAWMKCFVETNLAAEAKMRAEGHEPAILGPSPGFNNLRWLKPVCPDDTITYRITITGQRDLKSRPGWGMLFGLAEGFNQQGDVVFSFDSKVMSPKRP